MEITRPLKGVQPGGLVFQFIGDFTMEDKMNDCLKFKVYLDHQKKYRHFDYRVNNGEMFDQIKSSQFVAGYRFLPFIQRTKITYKFNGKRVKEKQRKITLASHGATLIYKVYADKLRKIYEKEVEGTPLDRVVTAYRQSSDQVKRSNIYAAKEIFDFISEQKHARVIKGDFAAFFDTLDHKYLKTMLQKLFRDDDQGLPQDWYAIFKSLTKFKYIKEDDLKRLTANENNVKNTAYFRNRKQFAEFYKKNHEAFKKNFVGIPQGTALSALFANIYMLDFDCQINEIVSQVGGIYRRYSDDFIIVLPSQNVTQEEEIDNFTTCLSEKTLGLTIQESKKRKYRFEEGRLVDDVSGQPTQMDYLGFRFTGDKVYLREKTIYKFAYKSKRGVNFLIRDTCDRRFASWSDDEIDQLKFPKPKESDEKGHVIAWKPASDFHNRLRHKQIKLVKRKLEGGVKFRISENNRRRYLSSNLKNRTFMSYVSRAQLIMEKGNPSYKVVVLKQGRRRIARNQRRFNLGTTGGR